MPLTAKGHEILAKMEERYGQKKGTSVFYASKNAGTITGVDSTGDDDRIRIMAEACARYDEAQTLRTIDAAIGAFDDKHVVTHSKDNSGGH